MKKRLNISANCFEVSFFRRKNVLLRILLEPDASLDLRYDMMLAISSLSVGCRNIELLFSHSRESNAYEKNEILYKRFLLYYIGCLTPNSAKRLYLIINMANRYIEGNDEKD